MKTHILVIALLINLFVAASVFAQSEYVKDFDNKIKVAEKIIEYDRVAWLTTDALRQKPKEIFDKLGAEWFCFKDEKGLWNAVYGKLEGEAYSPVAHFVVDENEKVTEKTDSKTTKTLDLMALSLSNARSVLKKRMPSNSPAFNQYIWQNTDKTFTVWFLPAFQRNGMAVYGGEAELLVAADGKTIKKESILIQPNFRGWAAKDGGEISLMYPDMETSPLEAVFFILYYKNYFEKITIKNKRYHSALIKVEGRHFTWAHIKLDDDEKKEAGKETIARVFNNRSF